MKHRPGGGGARRHGSAALSLSAFAGAKASTYDKRARLERERALNAKKARARLHARACCAAKRTAACAMRDDEGCAAFAAGEARPACRCAR